MPYNRYERKFEIVCLYIIFWTFVFLCVFVINFRDTFSSNTATSDFNNDHPVIFVIEDAFSSNTSDFNNDHPVIFVIEDSFSSNTANNDHPVIFVIEDSFSSNTANNDHPVIFVIEDGTELSIEFFRTDDEENEFKHVIYCSNTTENSQFISFHAPWLWSNFLNHIQFPGARKRILEQYPGTKISSAHITPASDLILGKFCNLLNLYHQISLFLHPQYIPAIPLYSPF